MDANAARTVNLRAVVAAKGGPAEFSRRYGGERWSPPQVSQWISESAPKGIGRKLARELEERLGYPVGWLDVPHPIDCETITPSQSRSETPSGYVRFQLLEGAGGMGAGAVNDDYPEVIREVDVAEWEVRRKLGFLPTPGRMRMITGRGPSMRPMIDNGEVVMVDTAVMHFDGDAVYVINVGGETQIKMLQMRGDGLYVVSANADYPAYKVERGDGLHVGGKVLAVMGIKEL